MFAVYFRVFLTFNSQRSEIIYPFQIVAFQLLKPLLELLDCFFNYNYMLLNVNFKYHTEGIYYWICNKSQGDL